MESLTQEEFGNKYGVKLKAMWAYEAGNIRPKTELLSTIGTSFGISLDSFLNVKLKRDESGKISNIPSDEKELQLIRNELKIMMTSFQQQVNEFFKNLELINNRINTIEKKLVKK